MAQRARKAPDEEHAHDQRDDEAHSRVLLLRDERRRDQQDQPGAPAGDERRDAARLDEADGAADQRDQAINRNEDRRGSNRRRHGVALHRGAGRDKREGAGAGRRFAFGIAVQRSHHAT